MNEKKFNKLKAGLTAEQQAELEVYKKTLEAKDKAERKYVFKRMRNFALWWVGLVVGMFLLSELFHSDIVIAIFFFIMFAYFLYSGGYTDTLGEYFGIKNKKRKRGL